ncbi:hypothetical protein AVEN_54584-1 [Araneus ventricosus]|uniref:Uncharacterized protein n=1 Tax=Araneus ventricosus TaxID=182803 RepID=A0A4Y2BMV1_ARAVE|nr:hypothetical protein AVEN_54584-1 [Araneus ventricosus]
MHTIRHCPGPFPSYLKRFGLHSIDYCGCGERGKSPTLLNEMPTNFISPEGTKPTIHSPLVEERPIEQTLKTKYRSSHQIPRD